MKKLRILTFLFIIVFVSSFPRSTYGDRNNLSKSQDPESLECIDETVANWETKININTVKFFLFPNPSDRDEMQEIVFNDVSSLKMLKWDTNANSVFLVHGFTQSLHDTFPQNVKNAYLKRTRESGERLNIIAVDWGKLAYTGSVGGLHQYKKAVMNVVRVGQHLGQLIEFLYKHGIIKSIDDVHLVGHSLGAHVSGAAGQFIQKNIGQPISRITGLDPAGPLFYVRIKRTRRLKKTDAKFIDVYHCNPGAFGIRESIGHTEFYPNSELFNIQPQCLLPRPWEPEPLNQCSHNYCPKFYAFTLLNKIVAVKCQKMPFFMGPTNCDTSQTAVYGHGIDLKTRGIYFVEIRQNLDNMSLFY